MRRKFEKSLAKELGLEFDDNDPVWCDSREVLITGGVRSGKSTRGAFKALCKSLDPKTSLIWFVGPQYPQAREEFRYVLEWGMRLGLVDEKSYAMPQDGICYMTTITGCRFETRSGEHPERLASVAPDMIVLCEPGQMSSEVYETALTRLLQKRGDLWMPGTLETDPSKPRWQWFEDFANDWAEHKDGDRERSFSLPSWSNTVHFPQGRMDPEFLEQAQKLPQYVFDRRYGGIPSGVQDPIFPLLWTIPADELVLEPQDREFVDGCIGVDYGTTWEHPSAIVVCRIDSQGDYWVSEAWKGIHAAFPDIESLVELYRHRYNIWKVCTDPNQRLLAEILNGTAASFKGQQPTMNRFSLANGLLENRRLFFDIMGPQTREVYSSMRTMGYSADSKGRATYDRPLDDDMAQALMYAIELLQTGDDEPPPVIAGNFHMRFISTEPEQQGRA